MLDFLLASNGCCQMDMNLLHDGEVLDVLEGIFIEGLVGSERSPMRHSPMHVDVQYVLFLHRGYQVVITPISS